MSKLYRRLCLLAAALVLSACGGGGGGGGDGPVLDGGVVKGPVLGATVCVFQLVNGAKGPQLALTAFGSGGSVSNGCYITPAEGTYNFRLPRGSSGDVLIESTGGTFCSNEVQVVGGACSGGGTLVNLGASVMTSAATLPAAGSSTIYTTPLTTAAVNAAAGATFSAARFNAQFATLVGQVVGNSAIMPSSPPTTATQPYLTQVSNFMQGGGSLTNAVNSLAQGTTTFTATGGNGTTSAATVHASFVGTHNLQFDDSGGGCGSACSYTNGQLITVTIGSDGSLSIPGKVLTNPFHRNFGNGPHTPEIIWLDTAANVEYALSDNSTGTFNEINVGNAATAGTSGLPGFIGQLRTPVVAGAVDAQLAAWASTYTIAYQYKGATVPWTSMTLAADGAITFNGGAGPTITAANIVTKYDRLACCDRIDLELNFDLNSNDDGVTGGDRISLYRGPGPAYELYSIEYDKGNSTVINDDSGVRLGAVLPLAHAGTAVPVATEISGTLGTTAMNFAITSGYVSNNLMNLEAAESLTGTPRTWLVQVSPGAALAQNVPYSCRTSPTSTVRVNARTVAGGINYTTDYGGRCTITLTRIVTDGTISEIEGTFTAELMDFKPSAGPKTVTNGVFHWVRP